jgi:hypothetical protein
MHMSALSQPIRFGAAITPVTRVLLACLLAVLLGACGGSYTKADFIRRADAICAAQLRALRALVPPSFGGPQEHRRLALAAYTTSAFRILRSEATQLRALKVPGESSSQTTLLQGYLAALDRALSEYASLAAAERAGRTEAASAAQASLGANPATNLAARYGLRSCSSSGATYR